MILTLCDLYQQSGYFGRTDKASGISHKSSVLTILVDDQSKMMSTIDYGFGNTLQVNVARIKQVAFSGWKWDGSMPCGK